MKKSEGNLLLIMILAAAVLNLLSLLFFLSILLFGIILLANSPLPPQPLLPPRTVPLPDSSFPLAPPDGPNPICATIVKNKKYPSFFFFCIEKNHNISSS